MLMKVMPISSVFDIVTFAIFPAAIKGTVIFAFPLIVDTVALLVPVPPSEPPGPAGPEGVSPPGAALTVTLTVFATESAFEGVIVKVTSPVDADEDANIVQDTPALCPPGIEEGEQPEEMLKSLGETLMLPNCAE